MTEKLEITISADSENFNQSLDAAASQAQKTGDKISDVGEKSKGPGDKLDAMAAITKNQHDKKTRPPFFLYSASLTGKRSERKGMPSIQRRKLVPPQGVPRASTPLRGVPYGGLALGAQNKMCQLSAGWCRLRRPGR